MASIIPIDPANAAIQAPIQLLRQVRDAMTAGAGTVQSRLDRLVRTVADAMHADVCSIYLARPGDILELYASHGLKQSSVHVTRLRVGEGLVGEIASTGLDLNLSEPQAHPKFAYRPETGEELYHSFIGVPRGFRALTEKHPELGGAHANLGLIYRQAGTLPEAVAALEKAVKASPRQPVFHNQLGITYRHAGQFTKAKEAYERAIELDPNFAAPHLNLGILNDLYLRDNQRALEMYTRYLVLSPQGDATVTKWVAEIKNRKPDQVIISRKERE